MTANHSNTTTPPMAGTGVHGLDIVLAGGFTPRRLYLIEGVPGSGKTTLAMQFLMEGAGLGEPVLYVTLSESEEEVHAMAESHGWSIDGVTIRETAPPASALNLDEQYTMFHPSEVELTDTTKAILAEVERLNASRIVLDSLSELRLLAGAPLRYRRQILALKQFFAKRSCTVLMLDDLTAGERDLQVQSIAHGVILLEQTNPDYGADRRRLRVVKYRGHGFRGGYHDYVVRRGGLQVFPRLVAAEHRQLNSHEKFRSGLPELDTLLGGGLERGASTLIVGAAGTGKSTIAAQFVAEAAVHGQRSMMFIFDENMEMLFRRADGLNIDLREHVDAERVQVWPIDPAELSPGELIHYIREGVEKHQVSMIVLDSLNGYLNAMPGEKFLAAQLHELLMYLGHHGVVTILIGAHQGVIGTAMAAPIDTSYLADNVLLLRYFEARGEVRQAISVVKKRGGEHERTIREFRMADGKIQVGDRLHEFRGVLTGVPSYEPGTSKTAENDHL